MIEIIAISILVFTSIVLVYQYSIEKIDQNDKLPFNLKHDIK